MNYVAVARRRDAGPVCLPNQFTLPQNIQTLEFIAGTEPTQTCTEPTSLQQIPVPSVVGLSQAAAMTILADAGLLREGGPGDLHAAGGHGHLPEPVRRRLGVPDELRDDHGVEGRRPSPSP